MNPPRGRTFDLHHHVGQPVGCPKPDQKVDVISRSADGFRYAAEGADRSAEVGMKAVSPGLSQERLAVFGAKDNVIMKAQMSGGQLVFPALLPERPYS